jgi:foldase protein PrsA
MLKRISVIALAAVVINSCGGNTENANSEKGGDKGTILAKVDDKVLTYEELQYQFPPEIRDQLRGQDLQEAVETWINTMVLAQKGRQLGLEKDSAVLAVIEFRRADAIARRVLELEIKNRGNVSQAEIDSVYSAEKESYKLEQDRFRASHILVATKDEADAIYSRSRKGDDFAKLAADYSVDRQSATNGGDIGFFAEDQIDPEFATAVKKLKMGEVSPPVKTAYGYHLIKLTEIQSAGSSPDSVEVKGRIAETLTTTRQGQAFESYLDSVKSEANIERFPAPELNYQALPVTQ